MPESLQAILETLAGGATMADDKKVPVCFVHIFSSVGPLVKIRPTISA
jgi:hypothetical protein